MAEQGYYYDQQYQYPQQQQQQSWAAATTYQAASYPAVSAAPTVTTAPTHYQAAPARTTAALAAAELAATAKNPAGAVDGKGKHKPNRGAAGEKWYDPNLEKFDDDDYRIFCGDVGNEVSDDALLRAFSAYPSVQRARVVRDPKTGKSKGFAFVSFKDSKDYLDALKEMHGKYCGNRPLRLRPSTWKDRQIAPKPDKKDKGLKRLGK